MSELKEGVDGRFDIDRFKDEVFKLIDYYRHEYKLTYAELIGELEYIKMCLVQELSEKYDSL